MIFFYILFALVLLLFKFTYNEGKKQGIKETIENVINRGNWIEIKKPISIKYFKNDAPILLKVGTRALITSKNESSGVWIWIAKPWELLYDSNPHYYLPSRYFS